MSVHVSRGSAGEYQAWRPRSNPWVRKIPWRREWLLTSVFLTAKFHGQKILVGYSPKDHKGSDTTEQLSTYRQKVVAKA